MTEKRIRVNAKSTSKGIWSFDVTIEINGEKLTEEHPDVLGEIKYQEDLFRADGRTLAGDSNE